MCPPINCFAYCNVSLALSLALRASSRDPSPRGGTRDKALRTSARETTLLSAAVVVLQGNTV